MGLKPDDTVCYCFHVSLRKVENFCRSRKPQYPSQISECLSAGTGCGWCVPLLKKVHKQICGQNQPWWREQPAEQPQPADATSAQDYESAEQYAAARQSYIQQKKQ